MGNVTYDRLKKENARLTEENVELKEKLKALENGDYGDNELLFKKEVSDREIYNYLRKHPQTAEFLIRKYPQNRDFIIGLTDQQNPLYLKEVADSLSNLIERETVERDITDLKNEKSRLVAERGEIAKEIKDYETKREALRVDVDNLKIEKQTLENEIKNLHGKDGLDALKAYLVKVSRFIDDTLNNRDTLEAYGGLLTLQHSQLDEFKSLKIEAEKLTAYLDSNPVTPEDIEKMKSELEKERDKIAEEMEAAKSSVDAVLEKNPEKALFKISQLLDIGIKFMEARPTVRLGDITPSLEEYFVPAKEKVDRLIQQIYSVKMDGKEQRKSEKKQVVSAPAGETESIDDKISVLAKMNDQLEDKQEKKRRWFK